MKSGPRILVASIFHEAHSFSPLRTTHENFVVMRGDDLLGKAEQASSALGGGVRRLLAGGARVLPCLSAVAPPGGVIVEGVYEAFRDEIVAAARELKPDGIFLDLHGSIGSEAIDDCEGDLLSSLRQAVGEEIPIAVSFDLHGNMTPRMLMAANIVVACKQNPHLDYDLAGERAAGFLLQQIAGEIKPVLAAAWIPMRLLGQSATGSGPLHTLNVLREQLAEAHPSMLDMSLFNAHDELDSSPGGQCVVALADGDPEQAIEAAETLAHAVWAAREQFTPDWPSPDSILAEAGRGTGQLTILGDYGDRVLAGTPGDGTFMMRLLSDKWPQLRAVVPVTDPVAVERAYEAGVGSRLPLALGGGWTKTEVPFEAEWEVVRLGDGQFVQRGPYLAGEKVDMGATAVLRSGNLTVLVTTRPGWTQDPEAFISNGISLDQHDVVVVKSGFHFTLSFAGLGRCVSIDTPGLSNAHPSIFPFQRRPPAWPEAANSTPDLSAKIFSS